MRQVPASAARGWRLRQPWLWLIGAGLMAAFAAVAWIQWRQINLLSSHVRYEGDNLVWSFFQLENEYMQLRDGVRDALRHPQHDRSEALRFRYELFASRLPLVEPSHTRDIVDIGAGHERTIQALREFLARHDPVLSEQARGAIPTERLAAIGAELEQMLEPIHDLTLLANQIVADQIARRNDAVRDQSRWGIGVTLFQSLLTLAFAVLTARQFKALTRRRQEAEDLAQHLHQARLEAEGASQAKSAFLANMSHELRTPFNGMLGMLSLLERSPLDARQAEQLRTARESATHLLALLNDILDISKLESGRLDMVAGPLSLPRLVDEVRALMAPGALDKGLTLGVSLGEDLPAGVVADGQRLRQILFNLMSNAVKFTERGGVTLTLRRDDGPGLPAAPTGACRLRFEVRDTGIGIDERLLSRLFQRFTQGDASSSRRYGGTGLGLEISRNLARRMGGDIEVQSRRGEGSLFVLRLVLPVCPEPPPVAAAPAIPAAAAAVAAPPPPATVPPRPLRLLVADDHPVNRRFMGMLLEQLGHQVQLVNDGAQALAAVQQAAPGQLPDLVLMDLHMPVLDGLETTRRLRALPPPAGQLPVVALTADAFAETRQTAIAAGMNDFLSKPVDPDDIQAMLARLPPPPVPEPVPALPRPVPTSVPATATAESAAAPRRRFKAADVAAQLDMAVVGEVCVGIGMAGYRLVLAGFFADESGNQAALLAALDQGRGAELKALAHAIKGSAASLGLRGLRDAARQIETDGPGWSAEQSAAAAQRLRQQLATTQALLQRMGFVA
ncbi:MAG: response regulator [Burkholderiaceae bacterium]|nr:response regulator [Burkholderiaceae bacterium]